MKIQVHKAPRLPGPDTEITIADASHLLRIPRENRERIYREDACTLATALWDALPNETYAELLHQLIDRKMQPR